MKRLWFRIADRFLRLSKTHQHSSVRPPTKLLGEQLEDRTVPNVSWRGEFPLSSVQIVTIYYGSPWTTNPVLQNQAEMLNTYFEYITNSPYMDSLSQYRVAGYPRIGLGSWLAQDFVNTSVSSSISDLSIQYMLNTELGSYERVPQPTGDTLYFVFTPPGTAVTYNGRDSMTGFMGYNSPVYNYCGLGYEYAVIPYPNTPNLTLGGAGWTVNPRNPAVGGTPVNAFQQLTAVAGAEMADAITLSWFDGKGRTVADLGRAFPSDGSNPYYLLNDYLVQELWSNQANGNQGGAVPPAGATTLSTTLSTTAGPTLLDPSAPTGNDPLFEWNAVPGANWYDLSLTDAATGATLIRNSDLNTNSFAPSIPLIEGDSYQWNVRAFSDDGVMGQFSSSLMFSCQAQVASLPFTEAFGGNQLSEFWVDEAGGFSISNNFVTALNATTRNVAVLDGVAVADVTESVSITGLLSGQAATLVARYQDPNNYYFGGITDTGNRFSADIYWAINGIHKRLAHTIVPAAIFNGTGTIEFEVVGTALRLILVANGSPPTLLTIARDTRISAPGRLGIRGSAGAQFSAYAANAVTFTTPSIMPSFMDPLAPLPDGQLSSNWTDEVGDFASNATGKMAATERGKPNVAVLNGIAAADVTESVDITNLLAGQSAALVARYQDPKNYYFGEITRVGNRFSADIYRIVNGVSQRLAHAAVPSSVFNGTGTIEFAVVGTSLRLILVTSGSPPTLLAFARDSRLSAPGSVGIRGNIGAQLSNYVASAVTPTTPSITPAFVDPLALLHDGQLGSNWMDEVGDFASNAAGMMAATQRGKPNVAVLNGIAVADATEAVDVTNLLAGQSAALVARYQDPENYYFGEITRIGSRFLADIYGIVNGVSQRLTHAPLLRSIFNGTGTIEFEVVGTLLRLLASDGSNPVTLVASAQDSRISAPGSVGIRGNVGAQFSDYEASD